ncbi:MAG: TetR/AcrR family transcriptional regulator [Defluviitaleaceae bacterium]|nr:TetR/AcrR family transcriptional regulator [Defluviitaleaceae bacterium]
MPRVTEEYFTNKKRTIVDAAIRVCRLKPAYSVTMRDVVRECGISQGGIYYYFSNIDEILVEIIDQAYKELQRGNEIDSIFESGRPPDEIIMESFMLIGRTMDGLFNQYRSLIHEIIAIQLNEPTRMAAVTSKSNDDMLAFLGKVSLFIESRVADGSCRGTISKEYILFLIAATITGIGKAVTFPDDAKQQLELVGLTGNEYTTAEGMMKVLAEIVVQLICVPHSHAS